MAQVNLAKLEAEASKYYSDFVYHWRNLKNYGSNITVSEHKKLIRQTKEKLMACDFIFDKIEKEIVDIKDDDAQHLRQQIKSYRKGFEDFYKIYEGSKEPNA